MTHLAPMVANDAFAKLKDRVFQPARDPALPPHADIFEAMRKQDILLHHPYESYDPVVELIENAAIDPQVLALKITLYRTSGDSPIVEALINAADAGKQVTALVELRARFDEANNIQWARRLEEAGAHVVYGVVGLKTHCKALLIVRRDTDRLRQYVHLGTGNYHPKTARIYTDFSLFTTAPELTEEVAIVFNTLTGLAGYPGLKKLLVAPFDLHERLIGLIEHERDCAAAGKPARIIAKFNSLVDQEVIEKLYEASCAGVKIDLIVRGICSLRPKIPGLSENIRVISIVGRFLEHSRIYYFSNDGEPQVYLASADWMPRNFYRRVEIAFPIEAPELRDEIINEVLPRFLTDHGKARELQADGTYVRLKAEDGEPPPQAQLQFREHSRRQAKKLAEKQQRRQNAPFAHLQATERTRMKKKILVVDIGGSNVKLMISAEEKRRKFASGSKLAPNETIEQIKETAADWDYDAISVGFPSPVRENVIVNDPKNLGKGWAGFDFAKALGKPTQVVNDAALQALGSYEGRRPDAFPRARHRAGLGAGLAGSRSLDGVGFSALYRGGHHRGSARRGRDGEAREKDMAQGSDARDRATQDRPHRRPRRPRRRQRQVARGRAAQRRRARPQSQRLSGRLPALGNGRGGQDAAVALYLKFI